MKENHQIVCLNMIAKNEARVIARCLASVRPIIDYWVIVDTGSTDGTQDAIRTLMADLPGELHERPWRDFAHNRNEALELAQPHGEYVLWIDADDVLEFEREFEMPALQADSYMLRMTGGSIRYNRQIVRSALPWRWRGVLHEFLTCDAARTSGLLDGLQLRRGHDRARWQDPQTFRKDAEILYAALQTEDDPSMQSRYQFYLAQSYRDCGENEKALQAYLKRAELGFWAEEVFMSLYSAAKLQEALGRPFDEVMATYLKAANVVPSRLEALHGASRYCRLSKRYREGYEIAKRAHLCGEAPDGLFVEPWIYEYGFLDEFAVNAYWAGAYLDSLDACERILRERKCPEAERPRIKANATFSRQKLGNAEILYAALTESDPSMQARYQFYLAQTYAALRRGTTSKAAFPFLKFDALYAPEVKQQFARRRIVVVPQAVSAEGCEIVLRSLKSSKSSKFIVVNYAEDTRFYTKNGDALIAVCPEIAEIERGLLEWISDLSQTNYFPLDNRAIGISLNVTPPGGGFGTHHDRNEITIVLNLNDANGGALHVDPPHYLAASCHPVRICPKAGTVAAFTTLSNHRVDPVALGSLRFALVVAGDRLGVSFKEGQQYYGYGQEEFMLSELYPTDNNVPSP